MGRLMQPLSTPLESGWAEVSRTNGKYRVSVNGEVIGPRGHILRPGVNHKGYLTVDIRYSDRSIKNVFVHKLVLETFIGSRPDGYQASHENGIKTGNRLENLKWRTATENNALRFEHGYAHEVRGEDVVQSKLTEREVLLIRKMYATGKFTQTALGHKFCVTGRCISNVVRRITWKHV